MKTLALVINFVAGTWTRFAVSLVVGAMLLIFVFGSIVDRIYAN